jgi:hypothetical protein
LLVEIAAGEDHSPHPLQPQAMGHRRLSRWPIHDAKRNFWNDFPCQLPWLRAQPGRSWVRSGPIRLGRKNIFFRDQLV